jgi:hypothetical protein
MIPLIQILKKFAEMYNELFIKEKQINLYELTFTKYMYKTAITSKNTISLK